MAKKDGKKRISLAIVPPYTGSVDARVPGENVELSHRMPDGDKWFAVSRASDGAIFSGYGATEPLARRIAGLRTMEHLKQRAEGTVPDSTPEKVAAAKAELTAELENLSRALIGFNGHFPETYQREIILIEIHAAQELLNAEAGKSIVARWLYPPLLFLGAAFADGVIGVYAERAVAALERLLAG